MMVEKGIMVFGIVLAAVSLLAAAALACAAAFLFFGSYWFRLLDDQPWDLDDE
jgi:hypothetical protein